MTKTPRRRHDPIHGLIEAALQPGRLISYGEGFGFVSILGGVADRIRELLSTDPARAVELCEVFLAGCNEKAEEIDDSDGYLGTFAQELVCQWIRARQAANAGPDETVGKLLAWMDDDPYGFCSGVERNAATAFDRKGLQAFERQARARFDAAGGRVWADVLRAIYSAQRDVDRYVGLCRKTELTTGDCETIAGLLQARRKFADALVWVEHGLELEQRDRFPMAGGRIADMKRHLLKKLGRGDEALNSAWVDFQAHPNSSSYDELMHYAPKAERAAWRERAMEAAEGGDLSSLIELWLAAKETGRLVERLRSASNRELEGISHYTTEPAAKRLATAYPEVAAKVFRALGMRIVNANKSRYYGAALANFQEAKRCYVQAGLRCEWDALVLEVRHTHRRKYSFMPGFERLAASR